MRFSFAVIIASLAVGCSGANTSEKNAAASAATSPAAGLPDQLVTLTGCLTGGEAPVGTTGPPARPLAGTKRTIDEAQAMRGDAGSAANRFMLTHAMPAADDS